MADWETLTHDQKEREITRLWRIKKTVTKMIHDRGYMVSAKELENTLAEFKQSVGNYDAFSRDALNILVQKKDDPSEQLYVYFAAEKQLSTATIRNFIEGMKRVSAQRAIIVYRDKITGVAKQNIAAYKDNVELFAEEELMVNITEHVLVPQHIVLTEEEKKQLLARYRLKETQLPRIQHDDPVARYYGLRRGNVVKIIRPSETAGRYVTYRICF